MAVLPGDLVKIGANTLMFDAIALRDDDIVTTWRDHIGTVVSADPGTNWGTIIYSGRKLFRVSGKTLTIIYRPL